MKACVLIPCFNHSATVALVARGALAHCPVIVVDDGSTEPLPELPGVHVIRFDHNRGKGAALRAGFRHASAAGFTHAITMDADAQHFPADLPKFLTATQHQPAALLTGVRDFSAAGAPQARRRANAFSNVWFRVATGIQLGDTQCGFRCYPLALTQQLAVRAERYAFELEIMVHAAWAGVAVVGVPVRCRYEPQQVGRSHFRAVVDTLRIAQVNSKLVLQTAVVPLPVRAAWARGVRPSMREIVHEFFAEHAHEPGRLALAVGLGIFCGIAPIWGWQTIATVALAQWLRLNKAVALLASNVSMPPLAPFVLWGGLAIGHWLFTGRALEFSVRTLTMKQAFGHLGHFFVGSFVLAAAAGAVGLVVTYAVAHAVRRRRCFFGI